MPTIRVGDTQVEYADHGAGEPVVLLHCTGSSGAQWRPLADALSDRYRVIAPDLYGYGRTGDWAGRRPISLGDEAALVAQVMDQVDGPVHLVGHSFGGAAALRIAREWPQRLRTLTVIEPAAFHLLRDGDALDARAHREISGVADTLARALACGDYHGGLGHFMDYWCGEGAWARTPAARQEAFSRRLGKVVLDFWSTLNDPARLDDLAPCDVPTLVIRGGRSPLPGRRIADHLARILRAAHLSVVLDASHMAPLTHPQEVNALIASHLDAHASSKRHEPFAAAPAFLPDPATAVA